MHVSAVVVFLAATLWRTTADSDPWARLRRTAVVRATLAKLDPNFWPARGRRSSESSHDTRQTTSDEEGPFWANRGRSLDALLAEISANSLERTKDDEESRAKNVNIQDLFHETRSAGDNRAGQSPKEGPFWANRGRASGEGPFWANRGRASGEGPFWANRGRASGEGTFWANRGRSVDQGPFSAERSGENGQSHARNSFAHNSGGERTDSLEKGAAIVRQTSEENPFWANRGRSIKETGQSNGKTSLEGLRNDDDLGRSVSKGEMQRQTSEDNPFWANRGRSLDTQELLKKVAETLPLRLSRNLLYAEEPGFIVYPKNVVQRTTSDTDPWSFWVSRGKRGEERGQLPDTYWRYGRNKVRALERAKDKFWPSRGKKSDILTNTTVKDNETSVDAM